MANQRACKAEVVASLLAPSSTFDKDGDGIMDAGTYNYDAAKGTLVASTSIPTAYGKGTTTVGNEGNKQDGYDPKASYVDGYLQVTITANSNKATIAWTGCTAKTSFTVGE